MTVNHSLNVRLKPSFLLTIILVFSHLISFCLLLLLELSITIKLTITFLIIVSCIYYVRKNALLLAKSSIVNLEFYENKRCKIITHAKGSFDCVITADSLVTPTLTVIIFKLDNSSFRSSGDSVILLPDSIEKDAFRKLRVWLRWRYH